MESFEKEAVFVGITSFFGAFFLETFSTRSTLLRALNVNTQQLIAH
jgi:hypothetical protein